MIMKVYNKTRFFEVDRITLGADTSFNFSWTLELLEVAKSLVLGDNYHGGDYSLLAFWNDVVTVCYWGSFGRDKINNVHTCDNVAECCIVAIKERRIIIANKELA